MHQVRLVGIAPPVMGVVIGHEGEAGVAGGEAGHSVGELGGGV